MLCISDNDPLMACHVAKFYEVTTPNPKVIGLIRWIISQFLTLLWKKLLGSPIPGRIYTSRIESFCGACKNFGAQQPLGAEIWSSEKVDFMGKH